MNPDPTSSAVTPQASGLRPQASGISPRGLFIGIQTPGTTSRMRWDALQCVTPGWEWSAIDTDQWFRAGSRLARSLAFRVKSGAVVSQINQGVQAGLGKERWDLVWIDKGVYLWPETVKQIRRMTERMIHYTPDTAFYDNRSRHFYATASLYDLLVTTKSFELDDYYRLVPAEKVHLTTQGYDATLHYPRHTFEQKTKDVIFIGLCEPYREKCIHALLEAGLPVRVGGVGWDRFVKKHKAFQNLTYLGSRVFGEEYATALSSAWIGLGLLSQRFPELHTTRTLEIPACATVLATASTAETDGMFRRDAALFFHGVGDLTEQVARLLENSDELASMSRRGTESVTAMAATHEAIVARALEQTCTSER